MIKKKMRKRKKIFTRDDITGYLFVFPFVLGFIFLFIKPLIQSTIYSFHRVKIAANGINLEPVGFKNYNMVLFEDGNFFRTFISTYGGILVSVIFIMFFSIFMALILNREFKGRLLFRTIAFLPVIFASDVAITLLQNNGLYGSLSSSSNEFMIVSQSGVKFMNEIMDSFGFGPGFSNVFEQYINDIFGIAWDSGIQIVLFIIGLRSIPEYLYEVCDIEGATKWETFWKITIPMLTPTILLCLVYTLIVQFNSKNAIIDIINQNKSTLVHYACAQTWIYSIVIFVTFAIVYKLMAKRTVYFD